MRPFFFKHFPRCPQHQGVTIDAGIHIPAVPVFRIFHHIEVASADIDYLEGKV
jgi:hypothetical protein